MSHDAFKDSAKNEKKGTNRTTKKASNSRIEQDLFNYKHEEEITGNDYTCDISKMYLVTEPHHDDIEIEGEEEYFFDNTSE